MSTPVRHSYVPEFVPMPITGPEFVAYFKSHAKQHTVLDHLWTVHTDMKAFKKVWASEGHGFNHAVANLVIPAGAHVRAVSSELGSAAVTGKGAPNGYMRKMRANQAYVHSIVLMQSGRHVRSAISAHDQYFTYVSRAFVAPLRPFNRGRDACGSGIHFFLNCYDACAYC